RAAESPSIPRRLARRDDTAVGWRRPLLGGLGGLLLPKGPRRSASGRLLRRPTGDPSTRESGPAAKDHGRLPQVAGVAHSETVDEPPRDAHAQPRQVRGGAAEGI